MAQCKMCGRQGFFLSVSANGLCKTCDAVVVGDVLQRGRIIKDCMRLVDESKNMETRLSRCNLLIEHAQALLQYEDKGIATVSPSPSQLRSKYTAIRDQMGGGKETKKPLGRRYKEINTELDRLEVASKQWNRLYAEQHRIEGVMLDRNLKGQELEKQGKIGAAIGLYESNIADEADSLHPYTRLAIIYRKQKNPKAEVRVLEQAIKVFGHSQEWDSQLLKAKQKLEAGP